MKIIDEKEVFSLAEVVPEELWMMSPDEAEQKAREWCAQNNAVFGGESALQTEARRIVIAESENIRAA